MKAKINVNGTHQGEPVTVVVEIEFDKGEYLDVLKTMPNIMTQVRSLMHQERKLNRAEKAMRKNAKQYRRNQEGAQDV